jgi:hypothetical protein
MGKRLGYFALERVIERGYGPQMFEKDWLCLVARQQHAKEQTSNLLSATTSWSDDLKRIKVYLSSGCEINPDNV